MGRIIASSLSPPLGCIIGFRNKGATIQRSGNFLAGLLVGLLSTGLLLLLTARPRGQPVRLLPPPTPLPLRVHVSGAVSQPGVYELAQGAIVEQAIEAAGGSLAAADLGSLNLAAPLHDGQQVVLHQSGEAQPQIPSVPQGGSGELVSVNTATAAELEKLPGIGPVLAQKIVEHRQAHGPFSRAEDLLNVSGIGPSILEAVRDFIVVP
jgi:competence protein ComEA